MHLRSMTLAALLAFCTTVSAQEEDGPPGREHSIPLFMANGDPDGRQGFIRIINHSEEGGDVEIHGIDDDGMRPGPITLSIGPRQTVHLNSKDVEDGNADKGLPMGLGVGEGNWRLLLYAGELDIEPLAYIRTTDDGFLTSMHDVVYEGRWRHRVPIFNPGKNTSQKSELRLINPGETEATVTITGRDDAIVEPDDPPPDPDARFELSIPARGAAMVTAQDLETGGDGSKGLGTGEGKWSLDVTSDVPIQVMSLMSLPTGHLSNLSAANPDYLGAAGLWQVSFEDGEGGDGYIILLPDSRMYAWLPEAGDVDRIARGTFASTPGGISGEGELYESGKVEQVGLDVEGGSDEFEFTAEYRPGDWIRGEYHLVGETGRAFHGWAFTGFERGGATPELAGLWSPVLGEDADLPGDFEPTTDGDLEFSFEAGSVDCDVTGTLGPINPAFSVYEADVEIVCFVLVILPSSVDLILAVLDAPDAPGQASRAIALAVVHDARKVALGAIFDLTRE